MKKLTVVSSIALTTLVTGVVYANLNPIEATVESPIIQEVKHQGEVIDNHEARLTNVEKDIDKLQQNTNTPPASNKVSVPAVVTPPPEQPIEEPTQVEQKPDPVTVVSYTQIPDGENTDCQYTYSDGTTYIWDWETVEWNQGTRIGHRSGICDYRAIGKVK